MVTISNTRRTTIGQTTSLALIVAIAGCNVSPAPKSTGGVDFDSTGGSRGAGGESVGQGGATADPGTETAGTAGASADSFGGSAGAGATTPTKTCERGVAIVTSDYKSTNIAISNLEGTTLSASFVSSGATKPGLALAISGDVDVPTVAPASKRVVILDRYGTNVITWMNLSDASVIAQLPIGTGFESNPHDYIEVDANRAFVARFGTNLAPGVQEYDAGGDLLILDTTTPAIVGRIPMPEEDATLLPRPSGMTWIGSEVVVTLVRWSADYSKVGQGRFVGVSPTTNAVAWTVEIAGLTNCGRVAVSPSGRLAAIACSSKRDSSTKLYDPATSDIVVYDTTTIPPTELRRLGVAAKLNSGIQPALTFATEDAILAKTYGGNATTGDTAIVVSATTGAVTNLAETTKPYVLGGLHCSPGCGNVCLMSDAERSRLRRWSVSEDGAFTALQDVTVDTVIGLPPRSIGGL
jgi:hypothetical protein